MNFTRKRYPDTLKAQVTEYDIYRFISHGNGLLIEHRNGEPNKLVACIFEVGYRSPDRTSYSLRLSVDESGGGRNLAKHIYAYSCLLAMEKGSAVKRGLIDCANLNSVFLHLNKIGFVFNDFFDDVYGLIPSFKCQLALNPTALVSYRINRHQLQHYINTHCANTDYMLVPANDLNAIKQMYTQTNFRVCAMHVQPHQHQLFALPKHLLGL